VAVAGHDGQCHGIGIDIERTGRVRGEFESVAFTPEERSLLASLGVLNKEEWPLRFWCAKEAVAKAVGQGMVGGPRGLEIREVEFHSGLVQVALGEELIKGLPQLAGRRIIAYTALDHDLIFASSLI
jgi:phosphopantetheinyl transferase